MQVDHGGRHVRVPHEFLQGPDVGSPLQKVGGEGVTQGVAGGPLAAFCLTCGVLKHSGAGERAATGRAGATPGLRWGLIALELYWAQSAGRHSCLPGQWLDHNQAFCTSAGLTQDHPRFPARGTLSGGVARRQECLRHSGHHAGSSPSNWSGRRV